MDFPTPKRLVPQATNYKPTPVHLTVGKSGPAPGSNRGALDASPIPGSWVEPQPARIASQRLFAAGHRRPRLALEQNVDCRIESRHGPSSGATGERGSVTLPHREVEVPITLDKAQPTQASLGRRFVHCREQVVPIGVRP